MSPPAAEGAPRVVLVTGASGFLGTHVCPALEGAGYHVRALAHHGGHPVPAGLECVEVDGLDSARALDEAVRGVWAVVHLAGRAHVFGERPEVAETAFRLVNVEGTRRLLEASAAAGVRHFVLMSSVAAAAACSPRVLDESVPPAPCTPYGRSKLDAERLLQELADAAGMRAVALRPPMVYGPGMKGNPLRLLRWVAAGVPVPVPGSAPLRSVVYAGNLAAAVVAALDTPEARGVYYVRDARDVTAAELARAMGRALGRAARTLSIPLPLVRAVGKVGDVLGKVAPFPIDSDAVDRLFGSMRVDASRLARETGFSPPSTLEHGIAATVRWYAALPQQP